MSLHIEFRDDLVIVRRPETRSASMITFRVLFYLAVLAIAAVFLPSDNQSQVTSRDALTSEIQ